MKVVVDSGKNVKLPSCKYNLVACFVKSFALNEDDDNGNNFFKKNLIYLFTKILKCSIYLILFIK